MRYTSTRDNFSEITASAAIVKGISDDGGLFVPSSIPGLPDLNDLIGKSYQEIATHILSLYLEGFESDEICDIVDKAYGEKFESYLIAPVVLKEHVGFIELFHGPTQAFKDMALSILPYLMTSSAEKELISDEIVILTATSGDTGKAALEGFKNIEGVKVVVFYPEEGVSPIQKKQMVTQEGENVFVVGLKGNFDDAQRGVKNLFMDEGLNEWLKTYGVRLSSANSINIGRLIPQIVYYVNSYLNLVLKGKIKLDERINIAVPTGNFGNILAASYAKSMGLPVAKLICATNDNNVLADFFRSGKYDRNRPLVTTSSPSMDILVSSNLERYLYHLSGESSHQIRRLMDTLASQGEFEMDLSENRDIVAGQCDEKEVSNWIRKVYLEDGYVMDPHTAVAYGVWQKYKEETKDETFTLIASTASPFKFSDKILASLGEDVSDNVFDNLIVLGNLAKTSVPDALMSLESKPVKHTTVCKPDEMKKVLMNYLLGGESHD